MKTKRCRHCGEEKPIDQFYVRHEMADGHSSWCKQCTIEHAQERNRKANPTRQCDQCGKQKPIEQFAKRSRICEDCKVLNEQFTRVCKCCGKRKSLNDFAPRAKFCRECRDKEKATQYERRAKRQKAKGAKVSLSTTTKHNEPKLTCRDCKRYPCFDGIDNIETLNPYTCRRFKQ